MFYLNKGFYFGVYCIFLVYLKYDDNTSLTMSNLRITTPNVSSLVRGSTKYVACFGIKYLFSIFDLTTAKLFYSSLLSLFFFSLSESDENGKLFNGSIIRYAAFLGKCRTILYRKTDPFYWFFKYLDSEVYDNKIYDKYRSVKGKWAEKYDAILMSAVKYKNMKGYN